VKYVQDARRFALRCEKATIPQLLSADSILNVPERAAVRTLLHVVQIANVNDFLIMYDYNV